MAWSNLLKELASYRLLILTVYAAVMIGIVASSFYVFSTVCPGLDGVSSQRFCSYGIVKMADVVPDYVSRSQTNYVAPIWAAPPPGLKMPPLEAFRLTKELVQQRVQNNVIVLTFGNFAFLDFILNWVKHLTDIGVNNLVVGAMDIKLLEALYWKGIPVFDMSSHINATETGWGSSEFHKLGRDKVFLLESFLHFGFELLMCDTDTVWLKNPLPYLARFAEADVLVSTDNVSPTVIGDQLEDWRQAPEDYNIGIFYWRPTEPSKKLVKEWKELIMVNEKIWDQIAFNNLVRRWLGPPVDEDSGLFYAYDGNLKLGLLPASIFCSGHTYFVQAIYKQLRLEPYVVHTTFQYAGMEGKRHRLREAMLFYDPPEYYDTPGGFLTFKSNIPKGLLLDGEHNIESHFALVNYQIKQIRTALAIASLLNRTLVMPPLWCRLDRMWFGHPGILPESLTRQPFLCPLDHVFKVDAMLAEFPEEYYGPVIDFREYSFFDNPSVPHMVKDSWLEVDICHEGSRGGCTISNTTNQLRILKVPRGSTEEMLKTVFSFFKDVKVIQFSTMQDALAGFTDKGKEDRFRKRVKEYTSVWCCIQNYTLGRIYYDMYWDQKPGWKPVPPRDESEDHPPL